MGILELVKIHRISITTVKFVEDVAEYEYTVLEMKFKLNPDWVPSDSAESEFDHEPLEEENEEEKSEEKK